MALRRAPQGYIFENWAGTQRAVVREVERPASEREVAATLREASERGQRIKVVGSGHSWSDAALPGLRAMALDRLAGPVSVDAGSGEVTVWGGTRLRDLNELLAGVGLAMPVLGSIAEQTVAGAIATGTHGSAPRLGNLASLVSRLRIALPSGEVAEVSAEREPDLFRAARVGLGALGVITQVTFRCVPAFTLEEEAAPLPFERALEALPGLLQREDYVKLWWLPHADVVQVFCYRRTQRASTFRAPLRWLDERVLNGVLFTGALALGEANPPLIPSLNRAIGALYFRPARSVARSDRCFNIAMPPRHDETEVALPVERTAEAMRWTRDFIARERLAVNFVFEARFGAGDDAWISPAHGRDSCFLGAYTASRSDRDRFFRGFEEHMRSIGGRPHWGKAFGAGRAELRPLYPRFDDFAALRASLDPRGVMVNSLIERVFLESAG